MPPQKVRLDPPGTHPSPTFEGTYGSWISKTLNVHDRKKSSPVVEILELVPRRSRVFSRLSQHSKHRTFSPPN